MGNVAMPLGMVGSIPNEMIAGVTDRRPLGDVRRELKP
jgi:hypothetical protein